MINQESIAAVEAAYFNTDFVRPLYDTYCFSKIPHLIPKLFSGSEDEDSRRLVGGRTGPYDTVVLLLIDGFGWQLLERYRDRYPFLNRFFRDGLVTKLTSQFPSTTAAHITTIHTGLTPAESGVYEWFVYEPSIDTVIQTLPFAEIGNQTPGSLRAMGLSPHDVFPDASMHRWLAGQGIRTLIFQSRDFTPSPFGDVVMAGAELHPFAALEQGVRDLASAVAERAGKRYLYLYSGAIDAAGHHDGPESVQFEKQVELCFTLLERFLPGALAKAPGRTLLLMTADHGHIEVDPAALIPLNRTFPAVEDWVRVSPRGKPMLPAGNARDVVLYIKEGHQGEAVARLSEHLRGTADVRLTRELIAENYFGSTTPSQAFHQRMGELIVLPHDTHQIWWDAPRYQLFPFRGMHGGLTRAEMETELLSYEL